MTSQEKIFESSALAKARRQEAADFGLSSCALEGVIATEDTRRIIHQWINGEIDGDELLRLSREISQQFSDKR